MLTLDTAINLSMNRISHLTVAIPLRHGTTLQKRNFTILNNKSVSKVIVQRLENKCHIKTEHNRKHSPRLSDDIHHTRKPIFLKKE